MDLIIEAEKENDFLEIYNLIKIAFQTSKDADGDEQDYVNQLRKSPNYIPELAFTIKEATKIIGHIMLTKTFIAHNEKKIEALLLSPVCVMFAYRNKGIASTLITHGLSVAKSKGYKAVFLVGQPKYYCKFGFTAIANFAIKNTGNIPEQYTMCIELVKGFLGNNGGTISIC